MTISPRAGVGYAKYRTPAFAVTVLVFMSALALLISASVAHRKTHHISCTRLYSNGPRSVTVQNSPATVAFASITFIIYVPLVACVLWVLHWRIEAVHWLVVLRVFNFLAVLTSLLTLILASCDVSNVQYVTRWEIGCTTYHSPASRGSFVTTLVFAANQLIASAVLSVLLGLYADEVEAPPLSTIMQYVRGIARGSYRSFATLSTFLAALGGNMAVRVRQPGDTLFCEVELESYDLATLRGAIAREFLRQPIDIVRIVKNGNTLVNKDADVGRLRAEDYLEVEWENTAYTLRDSRDDELGGGAGGEPSGAAGMGTHHARRSSSPRSSHGSDASDTSGDVVMTGTDHV